MMRALHITANYSTSTGPYVTCGFAIWFAMALFKYWWNNDNYNEIYLKSAPVVQWIMASIIAFGAGPIYVFLVRAVSALSFGFGTILGATQSLVNLWSNAAISGLGFADIIVCDHQQSGKGHYKQTRVLLLCPNHQSSESRIQPYEHPCEACLGVPLCAGGRYHPSARRSRRTNAHVHHIPCQNKLAWH